MVFYHQASNVLSQDSSELSELANFFWGGKIRGPATWGASAIITPHRPNGSLQEIVNAVQSPLLKYLCRPNPPNDRLSYHSHERGGHEDEQGQPADAAASAFTARRRRVEVDPLAVVGHVGVDAGEGARAAHAPRDDAADHLRLAATHGAGQRAAGVTLNKMRR